jgi:hypothetical protein
MPLSPAPLSQLLASISDLDRGGPPVEVLSKISIPAKVHALREASGLIATYARSRYRPPMAVQLVELLGGVYALPLVAKHDIEEELDSYSELDLAPITSGTVEVMGSPTEAVSIAVRATEGGNDAGLAVAWSHDGGYTYLERDVGTLDGDGKITIPAAAGLVFQFTGAIAEGTVLIARCGVEAPLGRHTTALAAFDLVYNRGVDPASTAGALLKTRYDQAMVWALDLQKETAKLDEKNDSTPGRRETRPRGGGDKDAYAFMKRWDRR